jgi:hypothetical protein
LPRSCQPFADHSDSNSRRDLRQLSDGAADLPDNANGLLRRRLNAGDLLPDLAGRLRGLFGEGLHFG